MSAVDVFNTGGHGIREADSWSTFVDADPAVARWPIVLDHWHERYANAVLREAVREAASRIDELTCTRETAPVPGQPMHLVGFVLREPDDGTAPRFEWVPTLVRVLDPRGERVEVLCEDCANAESEQAAAQSRCVSCWRGHHQGCSGEAAEIEQAASSRWCACACRAPRQRVDPPEWAS